MKTPRVTSGEVFAVGDVGFAVVLYATPLAVTVDPPFDEIVAPRVAVLDVIDVDVGSATVGADAAVAAGVTSAHEDPTRIPSTITRGALAAVP